MENITRKSELNTHFIISFLYAPLKYSSALLLILCYKRANFLKKNKSEILSIDKSKNALNNYYYAKRLSAKRFTIKTGCVNRKVGWPRHKFKEKNFFFFIVSKS